MITGLGAFTVRVREAVPLPDPLVAVSVTVEIPTTLGVPEMEPFDGLTVNPVGRPVAP